MENFWSVSQHAETHGQHTENQTNGLAATIAHKYLVLRLGTSEDVIIEKRNNYAECGKSNDTESSVAIESSKDAKESEGYHAQSRGQTVYAIDKVNGIDDTHNENHRQEIANEWWNLIDAQKAVERGEISARKHQRDSTNELEKEFHLVAESKQVIGNSFAVDEQYGKETVGNGAPIDDKEGRDTKHRGDDTQERYTHDDAGSEGHSP